MSLKLGSRLCGLVSPHSRLLVNLLLRYLLLFHVGQVRLFKGENEFLDDIPHVLLLFDADFLFLMDPGLQGKESRLVEGGRLDEYLGPVRVLLIHHLHVQLAFLEVNVILFEVFSDDVLDFGEFLRVLGVHLNALLM